MTRPDNPFEAASYDLNQFRERRVADRRFSARASADRRQQNPESQATASSDSTRSNSVSGGAQQVPGQN